MPRPGKLSRSRRPGAGEGFCYRFGELVGGGAGGVQLDEEGGHLLAECVFDQRRLVGPLAAKDLAEAVGLGFDAALAAGSLQGGLDLGAGQPRGPGRGRRGLEELAGLGRHRMCRLASSWPVSSTRATSWVRSAQSIPQ